jgi:hypothetical protein
MSFDFEYGDHVELLGEDKDSVNRYARVTGPSIFPGYFLVSNMNMPFQGTLCGHTVHWSELRLKSRHYDHGRNS